MLTVTAPAPATGGVRPQTRYTYSALQAYYKNGSGSIVASGVPQYRLTQVSACRTTSSCAGGADESKTTIGYGPQTAGTANNLLPVSVSSGSGDGLLTAATTSTYDNIGNLLTVDGPLSGTADTTRLRYDAARRQVGVTSPDPDGAGSLKMRGVRTTYNADGQVTKSEQGTVNSASDADWAAFASLQAANAVYDVSGRVTQRSATSGSTTYALAQYSYDAISRLTSLTQDLAGTTSDVTLTFGSYSPAGEIGSRVGSAGSPQPLRWRGWPSATPPLSSATLGQRLATSGV